MPKKIIKFKHILSYGSREFTDEFECEVDISNAPQIKIVSVDTSNHRGLLDIAHSVSDLAGYYDGNFIKEEHIQFIRDNEVLEVPSEWSYNIHLENMDYLTSLSVNAFINNFGTVKNKYFINGEEVELIKFDSLDDIKTLQEKFPVKKGAERLTHFETNEFYSSLQDDVKKLMAD